MSGLELREWAIIYRVLVDKAFEDGGEEFEEGYTRISDRLLEHIDDMYSALSDKGFVDGWLGRAVSTKEVTDVCSDAMTSAWDEIKDLESMPKLTKLMKDNNNDE